MLGWAWLRACAFSRPGGAGAGGGKYGQVFVAPDARGHEKQQRA